MEGGGEDIGGTEQGLSCYFLLGLSNWFVITEQDMGKATEGGTLTDTKLHFQKQEDLENGSIWRILRICDYIIPQ